MRVFVCAGMGTAKNQKINDEAKSLGKLLAKNDCTYIQGGSDEGLMGETLREFIKYSKKVEFVIPERFCELDIPRLEKIMGDKALKVQVVQAETDRLNIIKRCDKVIVLPGGGGTLEEFLYSIETARSKEHSNKVILVNIEGYFNDLLAQIDKAIKEGISKDSTKNFEVVNSVSEIDLFEE